MPLRPSDREGPAGRRSIGGGRHWVSPAGRRPRWRKAIMGRLLTLFGLGLRFTGLYGWGRRNALDVRRVEMEIAVPGLPTAFDGYRILHVSDTHLDVLPDLVAEAQSVLPRLEVDLLA